MWKWIEIAAVYLIASTVAVGSDVGTLTGKVTDASGKPIQRASVIVYHAGVKNGYSTLSPSCYADCGKRTFTDAAGIFSFGHLHPDLSPVTDLPGL